MCSLCVDRCAHVSNPCVFLDTLFRFFDTAYISYLRSELEIMAGTLDWEMLMAYRGAQSVYEMLETVAQGV